MHKTLSRNDIINLGTGHNLGHLSQLAVISSLWRVSDVSTAVMIKTFYRLYMNQNKAECLKKVAVHVKHTIPTRILGAFTLVGDYY